MNLHFVPKKEDFTCEICGTCIEGSGYTNHCNKCLHSKHVDIYPGDRANRCQGIMEPVSTFTKNSRQVIEHRCTKCGVLRLNKIQDDDNIDEVIELSAKV